MVTMLPIFISTLMTSAALIDILWARSPTVIVSGTMISRTTGSVGAVNLGALSAAAPAVLCRPPLGLCQPEAPCTSPRVLMVRRLTPSSDQTLISLAFLAPFLTSAPGATLGLCSVVVAPGAAGALASTGFCSAALRSRSCFSASSAAWRAASSSCWRRSCSRSSTWRGSIAAGAGAGGGVSGAWPGSASRLTNTRFFLTSTWMVRALPLESDFLMISEVCLRVSVILFFGSAEPCERRRCSSSFVLSCSESTSSAARLCTPAARSCSSSCAGWTFSSPANCATLVCAMDVLTLREPVLARLHDEGLRALGVDRGHLHQIIERQIGEVVARLHAGRGELRRQVLVHAFEPEERR